MEDTRILIVDDESYILELIVDFLALEDMVGIKSENFDKAVEKASSEKFDLIITDINIGNESVESFISSLRNKNIDTPIVLMTGDHRINQEFALEVGGIGIIHKPFQIAPFLSGVKEFLEK